jgi:RNA polymerase sigma-70 factor, ECF subfamily
LFAAPHRGICVDVSETAMGFEQEALTCLDDVYRFSLSLTRNRADADDLVQDTYVRAYRSWHAFQPGSDARRWLLTVCRNAFLRTRGHARRQPVTPLDRPDATCNAIDGLPESYRLVVVLVDVEDQSYEAAAAILGVPISTVRSRLFRARRQLRRMLAPYQGVAHTNV